MRFAGDGRIGIQTTRSVFQNSSVEGSSPHSKRSISKPVCVERDIPSALEQDYTASAMEKLSTRRANKAMTLLEVLVVVAVIAIVLATILPTRPRGYHNRTTGCLNHLRQINLGVLLYVNDNKHKFPLQFSVTDGGTMDFLQSNHTFPHYKKLSAYIHNPGVLICPTDSQRHAAANYEDLTDKNLSYFLNADVSLRERPAFSILAGDRNLQANGQVVHPGLFVLTTNMDMSWTSELHPPIGNLAFADGHAQSYRTNNFNTVLPSQISATNRLSVP